MEITVDKVDSELVRIEISDDNEEGKVKNTEGAKIKVYVVHKGFLNTLVNEGDKLKFIVDNSSESSLCILDIDTEIHIGTYDEQISLPIGYFDQLDMEPQLGMKLKVIVDNKAKSRAKNRISILENKLFR